MKSCRIGAERTISFQAPGLKDFFAIVRTRILRQASISFNRSGFFPSGPSLSVMALKDVTKLTYIILGIRTELISQLRNSLRAKK